MVADVENCCCFAFFVSAISINVPEDGVDLDDDVRSRDDNSAAEEGLTTSTPWLLRLSFLFLPDPDFLEVPKMETRLAFSEVFFGLLDLSQVFHRGFRFSLESLERVEVSVSMSPVPRQSLLWSEAKCFKRLWETGSFSLDDFPLPFLLPPGLKRFSRFAARLWGVGVVGEDDESSEEMSLMGEDVIFGDRARR